MGFQSVHVFAAKRTCSVVGTGGISGGKFLWWLVLVNRGVSKAFRGHGEGRIRSRHQDEYVLLRRRWWYWCMLCYICMYMESDPKPKESWHCH